MTDRSPYLKTLGILALFIISAIVVALTASGEEIWHQITRLHFDQITLLLLLSLVNYALRAGRWLLYTRALKIDLSLRQVLRHYVGGFALTMTPGRLGELIRLRWIGRETGARLENTAPLVLVDRAADLAAIGLLLTFALAMSAGGIKGGLPVALIAIALSVIVTRPELFHWGITWAWKLLGKAPRFFVRLRKAAGALQPFSRREITSPALALGALGWFAEGLAFYLLLGWLGADLGLWTCVAIFLFSTVTGGATGMPGGIGGAEAAMIALLSLHSVPLEISIPATAIIRITTLWFAVGLGLLTFPFAETIASRMSHALENN